VSDLSLVIEADASAVAATVANRLVERLCALQAEGQVPSLVLTGGTIADQVHRELAQAGGDLDWSRVELWWGDERFVPRDDPDRNEGQARTTFLDQVGVDPARVHPMPASDQVPDIAAAAASYAEELARHTADSGDDAVFDIVMLGIGPDGHVASLFPGHANVHVKGRAVVAETSSPKPPPARLSMTYDVLNRGSELWVLAAGEGKAEAVARALGDGPVDQTPAAGVRGLDRTIWFLDTAAARQL